MAGVNAARRAQQLSPVILPRNSSYIGTLLDDLVTKAILSPLSVLSGGLDEACNQNLPALLHPTQAYKYSEDLTLSTSFAVFTLKPNINLFAGIKRALQDADLTFRISITTALRQCRQQIDSTGQRLGAH